MMIIGGVAELFFGVRAEGQSLESIAKPLTVEDARSEAAGARGLSVASPFERPVAG